MNIMKPLQIGSVVLSDAGRDQTNYFLVVELVGTKFVKIVDGDLHKLIKPKTKNVKHLQYNGDVIVNLAEKMINSKLIYDAEVYSALRKYDSQNGGL